MRQLQLATSWGEMRLAGGSRAGEGSLLVLPQLRLALDAGRPARPLVPMPQVVVTHGHLDHVQGLLAWASQRQLQGMGGGRVYAPAGIADDVTALLATGARLEHGKPYDVQVVAVRAGDVLPLRREFDLRFFATTHWVETLGVCIGWTRHHLRPQFTALPEEELRRLKAAGEVITEAVRVPLLAYLGDTGPEVFEREPWLADVEVLVVECTFLREADRERARRFGHVHLDDLVAAAPGLRNRHLVLTHLSRRHRLGPGAALIRRALADTFAGALHTFNVEWE